MMRSAVIALSLASLYGLIGCGTRFGYSMQQGVASIATDPPALKYYIIAPPRLQGVAPTGSSDIEHAQAGALQRLLMTQVSDVANGAGFLHEGIADSASVAAREREILSKLLGFDPLAVVAYPSGYGVLYAVFVLLAVSIGFGIGVRAPRRTLARIRVWLLALALSCVLMFAVVRQTLIVEYVGQGSSFTGEPDTSNLVVPLPLPGLRTDDFVASYSPGRGAYFSRTRGNEMRSIVFSPSNALATFATITLHLLLFSVVLSSLSALAVIGVRLMARHFRASM